MHRIADIIVYLYAALTILHHVGKWLEQRPPIDKDFDPLAEIRTMDGTGTPREID